MPKNSRSLTTIERNILRTLQKDGRITYTELARVVGLSQSPCIERVKRLEKDGVIMGYTTLVNPEFLDASLVVFVQVRLTRTAPDIFDEFRLAIQQLNEVQECYLVSGNFDYLLKTRVADMAAYRKFYGETLLKLPGVMECTSYVVMEQLKDTLEVPINYQG